MPASKTVEALRTRLDEVDALFQQGDYAGAERLLHKGPDPEKWGSSWYDWTNAFDQEVREVEHPEPPDPREYVLDRVTAQSKRAWTDPGIAPRDIPHGNSDERMTYEDIQQAVKELVDEGALLYRRNKLWLPDQWAVESKRIADRLHKKAAKPSAAIKFY